jgi:preprotein translocase subunit SecA
MGNLDKREIERLDEMYNAMMKEINGILLSRILNATIPFEGRKTVIEEKDKSINDVNMSAQKPSNPISPDDLCPCGSGKKYSECHGNNIRYVNKIRRRR